MYNAINDALKDPEFRKEWEALEPEREIMHAIATNRRKCRMTHRELSKAAKISLRKLYKIEQGDHCSKQHYESVLSILLLYSFSIRSNVGLDTWSAFANCPLFSSRRVYRVYSKGNSSVMATFLRPL